MDLVFAGVKSLAMFASREKNQVGAVLARFRQELNCKHVGHVFLRRDAARPETFISVTYPGKWLINYALRSYFAIDPVMNHHEIASGPIILDDFSSSNGAVRGMLADARRFGLGRSFVSFTVMPGSERPGNVMFAFDIDPRDFAVYFAANEARLAKAARDIHMEILAVRGMLPESAFAFALSERERHCLQLLALGRAFDQIANELEIGAGDVPSLMQSILAKLDCTNPMQAVSRAMALGLIEFEPEATQPRNDPSPRPDVPATRH